jgi:DNA modification methylase
MQPTWTSDCGRAVLYCGDAVEILPTLDAASVDCVITDPPYPEISRDYGRMTEAAWHAMMDVIVPECRRVLTPTGSAVYVLQPNSERVGRMRPWLWEFMAKWTREWGMVQDAWWWNYTALPLGGSNQMGTLRASLKACVWLGPSECMRNQAAVLWGESQRNAQERTRGRFSMWNRPSGVTLDDERLTARSAQRGGVTPFNVLPIPNTNSTDSAGAFGHGAGTPNELADWWTRYICPPSGTVLDPFIGSGTVGLAAIKRGCKVIGIERMPRYFEVAKGRIEAALAEHAELLVA